MTEVLSSNLHMYLRIKPEQRINKKPACFYQLLSPQLFHIPPNKTYPFDYIFTEANPSAFIYQTTAMPLLDSFLEGYNATYFVYGQTGTGKTYTMGLLNKISKDSSGIVPEGLRDLFARKRDFGDIYISFYQIYKDEIRDLLNPDAKGLIIMEKKEGNETFIKDLVETRVDDLDSAIKLINAGLVFRKMGSQKINKTSSRSHTILSIYLKSDPKTANPITLSFVDLAGSERVKKSSSKGAGLEEAKTINSSLSTLAGVISALGNPQKDTYIPYRDSKLTRILRNSLGGDSKIVFLATINESKEFYHESLGTLAFLMRCKGITINAVAKPLMNQADFNEYENIMGETDEIVGDSEKISKNNEENENFQSNYDNKGVIVATFLIKMLRGIEKLIRKEGNTTRNQLLNDSKILEKSNLFAGKLKYNFNFQETALKQYYMRELANLDQKYPFFIENSLKTSVFEKEFDENSFKNTDFDEIINKIQSLAEFIIKNLKHFINSFEEIKKELIMSRFLYYKREEELENWVSALTFSLEKSNETYQKLQQITLSNASVLEIDQNIKDFQQELLTNYEKLINKNEIYSDFEYIREKLRNIPNFSPNLQKIKDFSLMESLKTLEKYTSNSVTQKNAEIDRSLLKNSHEIINSIFEKEQNSAKNTKKESAISKELQTSQMKPSFLLKKSSEKPKIFINLGELSEIKKSKLKDSMENSSKIIKSPENSKEFNEKNEKTPSNIEKSLISPFNAKNPINFEENNKIKEEINKTPHKTENIMTKTFTTPQQHEEPNENKGKIKNATKSLKNPPSSMIKFLENEILNEMKKMSLPSPRDKSEVSSNSNENLGSPSNKNEEIQEIKPKMSSSEIKNKIIPNNLIKSVFDRNSIKTRNNTILLKERGSSSHHSSPKLKNATRNEDSPIKKKSEINNEETLMKFLDNF